MQVIGRPKEETLRRSMPSTLSGSQPGGVASQPPGSSSSSSSAPEPVQVFVRIRPEPHDNNFSFGDGKVDVRKSGGSSSSSSSSSTIGSARRASVADVPPGGGGSAPLVRCIQQRDAFTLQVVAPDSASSAMRKPSAAVDDKIFTFDRIFSEDSTQEGVYESVSAHVKATVKGYNTTIFAYGSTGSGKSFTMTGTSSAPGIIPRAISEIFSIIETTAAEEQDVFFYVRLSYVELYNNSFRNLLDFASKELGKEKDAKEKDQLQQQQLRSSAEFDDDGQTPEPGSSASPSLSHTITNRGDRIEVRESSAAGVFLAGPNIRIPVTTAHEAFQLVAKGNKTRAVGSTNCNDFSSRSHAILTLHVESRVLNYEKNASGREPDTATPSAASELRLGKMHLVDLAGSERVKLSGAEGDTLVESQNINLSLSALGDVLSALSRNAMIMSQEDKVFAAGKKANLLVPVPYRNSKLTHLLKDSLGGNSKTIMIATVRTHAEYYQQTAVSLMYAARAKKVRNKSLVNRNVIGDTGIHAITSEIERLRTRLDERSSEFTRLRDAQLKDAQENSTLKARLTELHRANEAEKKQLESQMSHIIHSQAGQLASQTQKINMLQKSLQEELALSQNRIAEQEREIKWLKKALDESAVAANQPIEKLERMQKVVDALQEQASLQKQQIEYSNNQIGSFKADLDEAVAALSKCRVENEALLVGKENAENECDRKRREVAEVQLKCRNAEAALRASTEDLEKLQAIRLSDLEKAADRIHQLEKERKNLHEKLTNTVSSIEKQMAGALEEAAERIDRAESGSQQAVARALASDQEAGTLRSHLIQARDALEDMKSANGDLVRDVKDLTRQLHEDRRALDSSSTRCKELEVTVHELSDTLRRLNSSCSDAATNIESQRSAFESELAAKALEIASQKKAADELRRFHDGRLAAMEKEASNAIAVLKNEFAESQLLLANLKEKHDQEVELLQRSFAEQEERLKDHIDHKHIAEIETIENMYKEKIKLMEVSSDQLATEHRAELDRMELQVQEDVDARVKKIEKNAERSSQELVQILESSWLAKLEAAETEHMNSVKNLSDEMKRLREEELYTLRSLMENDSNNAVESLRHEYASAVEDLRTANEAALLALNQTHVSELDALKEASAALEKNAAREIDRLNSELRDQHHQHQRDVKAMSLAHTQEMAKFDKKAKATVAEEKAALQKTLQLALEGEREELRGQHAMLLESVQEQHSITLQEALIAREKVLLGQFDVRMRTLDAVSSTELTERLQAEELAARARERELLNEAQANLQEALSAQKLSMEESYALTRQETERILALEKEEAIREAVAAAEELQRLEFKKAMSELRSHYALEKAEFERKSAEQAERQKQELASIESQLKEMQQTCGNRDEDMQKVLAEHEKKVRAFLEEKAELRRHLEDIASVVEKQASEYAAEQKRRIILEAEATEAEAAAHERHANEVRKLVEENASMREAAQKFQLELATQEEVTGAEKKRLEAAHSKIVARLSQELTQSQERSAEIMASAASRQGVEAKMIREQREEFDAILQSSLSERDAHYKMAMKQMEENFALDKKLLLTNQERAKARHEDDIASHAAEYESAVRRLEASTKDRLTKELDEAETKYAAQLEAALEDLNATHLKEINSLRIDLSNQESLDSALRITRDKLEESKALVSKQRTEFDEYKAHQADVLVAELRALEGKHKLALVSAEEALQEREARLQSHHQQQCRALKEESEAAVLAAIADERNLAQQKIAQLKEIHRNDIQEIQTRGESLWNSDRRALELVHSENLRTALDEAKSTHAYVIQTLHEDHSAAVAAIAHRLNEDKKRHDDTLTALTTQSDANRANLERIHAAKLTSLEDDLSALRESALQQKRKYNSEIEDLKRGHEDAMREVADVHALQRQTALNEVEERHARTLQEALSSLSADHAAIMLNLEKDKKILEARLRSTQSDTENRLLDTESALSALSTEMLMLQQKQASALVQHERTLSSLTQTHEEEIVSIREKFAKSAEQLVREHESKVIQLEAKHVAETSALWAQVDEVAARKGSEMQSKDSALEELTQAFAAERALLIARAKESDVYEDQMKVLKAGNKDLSKENSFLQSKFREIENELKAFKKAELDRVEQSEETSRKMLETEKRRLEQHFLAEMAQLSSSLQTAEHMYESERASLLSVQTELDAVKATLAENEGKFAFLRQEREDMEANFGVQQNHLQGDYLSLLQKQTESLMAVVEAKSQQQSVPHIEEMETRFLELVKNLPQLWKQAYGSENAMPGLDSSALTGAAFMPPAPSSTIALKSSASSSSSSTSHTKSRVPLHLLKSNDSFDAKSTITSQFDNRQLLPWTSPTLRSSPTDQLVAAILDGDVQGVRAVVRSKGDDLNTPFWKDLARSVLPLHRAVSGLHFHGSERLLVATIEALTQLGAEVNATDQAGNSVLHKAIQVCTSKSVGNVVQSLISRGANASAKNRNGDSPLHLECDRVRSASVEVLGHLLDAGASPNARNSSASNGKAPLTPLSLLLLRGSKLSGNAGIESLAADADVAASENADPGEDERCRMSGRGVWIRTAEALVSAGAAWDSKWRSATGASQLHLLLQGFPAPPQLSSSFRSLLSSAIDAGLKPSAEDMKGKSGIFVLCERLAAVSSESCPDAARVVRMLLEAQDGACLGPDILKSIDALSNIPKSALAAVRPVLDPRSSLSLRK